MDSPVLKALLLQLLWVAAAAAEDWCLNEEGNPVVARQCPHQCCDGSTCGDVTECRAAWIVPVVIVCCLVVCAAAAACIAFAWCTKQGPFRQRTAMVTHIVNTQPHQQHQQHQQSQQHHHHHQQVYPQYPQQHHQQVYPQMHAYPMHPQAFLVSHGVQAHMPMQTSLHHQQQQQQAPRPPPAILVVAVCCT
ncbi:hypothetical protein DIPPA_26752 [Diplonema papillatum]|nr:hypothetical protein DIPPA_26752 [Diplonema papillatum]